MTWKKWMSGVLCVVLAVSVLAAPMASAAGQKGITITESGYYMKKLSNPTLGEGEADGLVTPGDRFNSYGWATGELGDYIYVGSNRNLVGGTATSYAAAVGVPKETLSAILKAFTNDEIAVTPDDELTKGGVIVRYNKTTGEMETVFLPNKSMPSPFNDITGYRMCVAFKGSLYFGTTGSENTMLIRIGPDFQPGDLPEIIVHMTKPEGTGMGNIRAYDVTDDGERLYIGGTDATLLTEEDKANNISSAVHIQTSTDGEHFETIACPGDFYPYNTLENVNVAGDVWDLVVYQDEVYLSLMTNLGAAAYKGVEVGKGAPGANAYGWKWSEYIGNGIGVQGDPICPAGFGNPKNYTVSPVVYKGDLYYFVLSNAVDAVAQGLFGMLGFLKTGDINKYFDSLKIMESSMQNKASIYRLDGDRGVEMVMGSPDAYFNRENGNYLSETYGGFSETDGLSCLQYIWRAAEYNGKLIFGTFDASTLYHAFTKLTNGDLIGMPADECESQIRYAVDLLNLLSDKQLINEKTEDLLVGILGTLNSLVDKQATEQSVKQLLNSALQFKKAFDQISPVLDKILNADWFTAMAGSVKGVKALKDLYNALANVNTEGLERYIRISNAIMDNTGGFELYSTEDGVHYTQLIDHGFHDRFNYGCRSFIVGSDGLYIGTANPFYGAQLWKMNEITADLETLSADGIELNFDPAVTDYQASVASDVDAIHLTAVGADAGTQVLVNGISAADGAIPVALQAGKNVIRIETASIDGSETAVYTLTVTRGALPAGSTQLDPTEPDTQEPTKPEVPGTTIPGIGQTVKPQDMQSPSVSGGTEAPEQTETRPASNVENVEIPDTGGHTSASMLAVLALGAAAAVALSRKKRR